MVRVFGWSRSLTDLIQTTSSYNRSLPVDIPEQVVILNLSSAMENKGLRKLFYILYLKSRVQDKSTSALCTSSSFMKSSSEDHTVQHVVSIAQLIDTVKLLEFSFVKWNMNTILLFLQHSTS
jgi:hypothetical protein